MSDVIPNIIHHVFIGDEICDEYQECCETVEKHFSDWEIKVWINDDNREFIQEHFNWFLDTYDGFDKDIYRIDAVRYFILYKFGGMYMDMDITVHRKFDHLLCEDKCYLFPFKHRDYFKHRGWDQIISNCMLATPPEHPFIDKAIVHLASGMINRTVRSDDELIDVFAKTGPIFLTKLYHFLSKANPRLLERVEILDIIDDTKEKDSYIVHESLCKWIDLQ